MDDIGMDLWLIQCWKTKIYVQTFSLLIDVILDCLFCVDNSELLGENCQLFIGLKNDNNNSVLCSDWLPLKSYFICHIPLIFCK